VSFTNAIFHRLLPLLGLLVAACATPPVITVTGMDVVETGVNTSEVALRLEIQNTTGLPIRLDTWDYNLLVGESQVYNGAWVASITIPPESRVLTAIPAVISNVDLPNANASWRVRGWIRYLEPNRFSQMLYDLGLNRPSAGFSGDGTKVGSGGSVPSAG